VGYGRFNLGQRKRIGEGSSTVSLVPKSMGLHRLMKNLRIGVLLTHQSMRKTAVLTIVVR
jgi:hypothetical protein